MADEFVDQLTVMGFPPGASRRAALAVAYESVELAIEWMLEHGTDGEEWPPSPAASAPPTPAASAAPTPAASASPTPTASAPPTPRHSSEGGDGPFGSALVLSDRSTSEAPAREPSVEPFDARFSNQEAEAWTVGWSPENSLPYYSNALLGQTTWEPPTDELRAKGDAMRVAAAWTVGVSPEHNLPYYSNALLGETTWEPPTEELAEYGRALMAGSRSSTPPSADPDVVIDSQLKPEGNLIAHGTTSQYTWERRGGVLALALLLSALSICSRGEAGMGAQPTCRSRESPRR